MRSYWLCAYRLLIVVLLLLSFTFILPDSTSADGAFFSGYYQDIIEPAQKAMIVYDDNIEELIIQVKFEGKVTDFAWVVPVPNYPGVEEADKVLFSELSNLTRPLTDYRDIYRYGCGCVTEGEKPLPKGGVDIWEEKRVGNYSVTILSADDSQALIKWLGDNGYVFPDTAQSIVEYYVKNNWFFVAMKIDASTLEVDETGRIYGAIEPVRLSFTSDTIIYPMKLSSLSAAETQNEILLYIFADYRVHLAGGVHLEYAQWVEGKKLGGGYPTLAKIVDRKMFLSKLRIFLSAREMNDDLLLYSASNNKEYLQSAALSPSPINQFLLIVGVALALIYGRRIKGRR